MGSYFRGDCRDPHRMAAYGDRIATLTLDTPLVARGKVSMLRGVTDSTASIGFYNATWSMKTNPSQNQSIPMDYLGINIEGPSREGFFFYPVYRVHGGQAKVLGGTAGKAPRIYPDRTVHDWSLAYDPGAANGRGRITVSLDKQSCTLDLADRCRQVRRLVRPLRHLHSLDRRQQRHSVFRRSAIHLPAVAQSRRTSGLRGCESFMPGLQRPQRVGWASPNGTKFVLTQNESSWM